VLRCLQQEKMLVEYDNARVLITDMKIEAIKDIIPLLEQVTRINLPLVIIAEDVTGAQPRGSLL
jgi:chaperonin GroEL (HSP60 family)